VSSTASWISCRETKQATRLRQTPRLREGAEGARHGEDPRRRPRPHLGARGGGTVTSHPQGASVDSDNRAHSGSLHGPAPLSAEGAQPPAPSGPLTDLARALPRGRTQATSISELAATTGLSEREVRAGLSELLTDHRVPVVTLPTRRGVYLAETPEDIDQADAHIRSKAMSLLRRRRALRLCRETLAYRPTLFEI